MTNSTKPNTTLAFYPEEKKLADPYTARKWDLNQILTKTVIPTSSSIDPNSIICARKYK